MNSHLLVTWTFDT